MKSGDIGLSVREHLIKLGIETPLKRPTHPDADARIREHVHEIMLCLGLDADDDSLRNTPYRVAKMYTQEIFWGLNYANFPEAMAVSNTMKYDELLATKCTVRSVCEHHLVPFTGTAWIGYLPKTKILGLSKFNRVVDFFSRRPQIQERLTAQITAALQLILETKDVACVIRASHMCVMLRGIEDYQSMTVTSEMGGRFFSKAPLRQEFLNLVNNHSQ